MSTIPNIARSLWTYYNERSPIGPIATTGVIFLIALELVFVVCLIVQNEPWAFDTSGILFSLRYVNAALTLLCATADFRLLWRRFLSYRLGFTTLPRSPSRLPLAASRMPHK